ncbi:MAG: DHH family phosphoesterase [Anaerolineae bacterium]|nr:DHH family phosphoesterase [Anaerolineae bacterium]NUQ05719.1 DHH family phosphoesterase [Anaerolineae bacterium]
MTPADAILVTGHRNPDMDAVASAVGYAWLLNAAGTGSYSPGRVGAVNAQTQFALEHVGVEAPPIVNDIRARVGDLTDRLPTLTVSQTVLEACQSIARTRRPAPLLDADGKPLGLLTGAGLFAHMADALGSASVMALAKEFELSADRAADAVTPVLNVDDHVRDVIGQVLRADHDDFLVVDADGRYTGLVRKTTLMSPPRRRVVMVDHNELEQSVPGLEEGEVVEVLDHHRLATIPTSVPIRFQIDPVGSCSTLVTERAQDLKKAFPAGVAGLLLCGILSDTLIFRSPTTTARDRAAARILAGMAGLAPAGEVEALDAAIRTLGESLLNASAGIGSRAAGDMVTSDLKYYEEGGMKVGIAQIEVTNFSELPDRLGDIRAALAELMEREKLALALLMVTDVVRGNSRLIPVGQARVIATLPYTRLDDDTFDAPGMMSRKKQLLPAVLAGLAQLV